MLQLRRSDTRNLSFEGKKIIVSGGPPVPHFELSDYEEQTEFFHAPITAALGSKQLGPPDFKVAQIIRVMQISHRIGFAVSHSDLGSMLVHSSYIEPFRFSGPRAESVLKSVIMRVNCRLPAFVGSQPSGERRDVLHIRRDLEFISPGHQCQQFLWCD